DADLDRVGARGGDRPHRIEPLVVEPSGEVRHHQLAARGTAGPQVRLERARLLRRLTHVSRSPVSRSAICATSLSPRPESVPSTVEPSGTAFPASRTTHAMACADSSAGTIPSVTAKRPNAPTASSSVAAPYSARPVAASCACSGPTPG